MNNKKPEETKRNLKAEAASARRIFLLVPFDDKQRAQVEELCIAAQLDVEGVTVRTSQKLAKLNEGDTVFVAVAEPSSLGMRKQPANFQLRLSPPIPLDQFITRTEEDDVLDTGKFVDTVQKYARPNVCQVSEDKILKLGIG